MVVRCEVEEYSLLPLSKKTSEVEMEPPRVCIPCPQPLVKGGAMKDHRGGEKLCLSHKSCRHSGCRMSARLGTGRIVDAASRDEPRAGLAVTADTR